MRFFVLALLLAFVPAVDMWVDTYGLVWITADPTVPVLTIEVTRNGAPFPPGPVSASFAHCTTNEFVVSCTPKEEGVWMLVWVGVQAPPGAILHVRASSAGRFATLDIAGPPAPSYLPLIQS